MIHNVTIVSSALGGAGKSTVAAGLGCAFALLGDNTLLLDCNLLLGGPASLLEAGAETPYHLGDVSAGRCSLSEAVYPCRTLPSLSLTRPPAAPEEFPDASALSQWLSRLTGQFDRIIADVPFWSPCFGPLSQQAGATLLLTGADRRSADHCDRLRSSPLGQRMAHPRLVINRFHRKQFWKQGEFSDLDQVIDRCGLQLMAVIPEDPALTPDLAAVMAETQKYEKVPFRQKGRAGAVSLHCLARRLKGERIPLGRLDWL